MERAGNVDIHEPGELGRVSLCDFAIALDANLESQMVVSNKAGEP